MQPRVQASDSPTTSTRESFAGMARPPTVDGQNTPVLRCRTDRRRAARAGRTEPLQCTKVQLTYQGESLDEDQSGERCH